MTTATQSRTYLDIFADYGGMQQAYAVYIDNLMTPEQRDEFEDKCYSTEAMNTNLLMRVLTRLETILTHLENKL